MWPDQFAYTIDSFGSTWEIFDLILKKQQQQQSN